MSNAKRIGWPLKEVDEGLYLAEAPGGYHFYLLDKEQPQSGEDLHKETSRTRDVHAGRVTV